MGSPVICPVTILFTCTMSWHDHRLSSLKITFIGIHTKVMKSDAVRGSRFQASCRVFSIFDDDVSAASQKSGASRIDNVRTPERRHKSSRLLPQISTKLPVRQPATVQVNTFSYQNVAVQLLRCIISLRSMAVISIRSEQSSPHGKNKSTAFGKCSETFGRQSHVIFAVPYDNRLSAVKVKVFDRFLARAVQPSRRPKLHGRFHRYDSGGAWSACSSRCADSNVPTGVSSHKQHEKNRRDTKHVKVQLF